MQTIKEIIKKAIELKADKAEVLGGKIYFITTAGEKEFDCAFRCDGISFYNENGETVTRDEYKAAKRVAKIDCQPTGAVYASTDIIEGPFGAENQINIEIEKF